MARIQARYTPRVLALTATINQLDEAELTALFEIGKDRQKAIAAEAATLYSVGDEVRFFARKRWMQGRVVSVGGTNVKVEVPGFSGPWTVEATLLSPVARVGS